MTDDISKRVQQLRTGTSKKSAAKKPAPKKAAAKKAPAGKKPVQRAPAKKAAPKRAAPKKAGTTAAARKKAQNQKAAQASATGKEQQADDESVLNVGFKFPRGNKFWQCRAKHGKDGRWATPEDLLKDCLAYFEWLENNPLFEEKGFAYQGDVTHEQFTKMRVPTMQGLNTHLGITRRGWDYYCRKPDYVPVCEHVESLIYQQKFEGAAAELLNPAIIARDLGLADKVSAEHTGRDGGPIETITADMSNEEAARRYQEAIRGRSGG